MEKKLSYLLGKLPHPIGFLVVFGGPSGPVLREQKRARQATKNQISTGMSQEVSEWLVSGL